MAERIRELALSAGAGVTEEVKYGGILFSAGQSFCGVFAYAKHVSVEFSHGADLPDPHGVLEGTGKFRRHIKLHALADIADKHVSDYIEHAMQQASKH
ncbi:MAG: DUF1801 domain-containing protein [Natronospirillum sp.]